MAHKSEHCNKMRCLVCFTFVLLLLSVSGARQLQDITADVPTTHNDSVVVHADWCKPDPCPRERQLNAKPRQMNVTADVPTTHNDTVLKVEDFCKSDSCGSNQQCCSLSDSFTCVPLGQPCPLTFRWKKSHHKW